jgi:alanine racemase
MPAQSPAAIVIDLDALARNFRLLRHTVMPAECGAVVKANAYGLGMAPVARRLLREGCRTFFVATCTEGIELRELAPHARIFVFEGAVAGCEGDLRRTGLIPVLSSLEQTHRWSAGGGRAALHVDTGMSRLGLGAAEVRALATEPSLLHSVTIECVMTHLACADEPDHPLNRAQLDAFAQLRGLLPQAPTSIGNSAGAFLSAEHHGDLVRPGIALYGGNPFVTGESPVEPVVRVQAPILQIRPIETPQTVGYGATYAAAPPARLATVGIGYADGYPRALGNVGCASVAGVRVPVVGRVSMDLLCLDITAAPAGVAEGTLVDLIGPTVPIDEVAAAAGTISYELLTRLGARLLRQFIGQSVEDER